MAYRFHGGTDRDRARMIKRIVSAFCMVFNVFTVDFSGRMCSYVECSLNVKNEYMWNEYGNEIYLKKKKKKRTRRNNTQTLCLPKLVLADGTIFGNLPFGLGLFSFSYSKFT